MNIGKLRAALAGACALVMAGVSVSANAQEMIYATLQGPKQGTVKVVADALASLSTGSGAQQWRVASGGQILSGRGSLQGLSNGVADAAFIVPVYTRAELPANSVLFDYVGPGGDIFAGTGASLETIFQRCPQCLKEYEDVGTKIMSAYSASPNKLMCGSKVASAADVHGKKIRAVGALARIVEQLGGVPVNMAPDEGVTAMQRGTLDCLVGPPGWLTVYGYIDVVKWVVDEPVGFSKALAGFVMNSDSFERLNDEQKNALLDKMPQISAYDVAVWVDDDAAAMAEAKAKGISFVPADDAFHAAIARFREVEAAEADQAAKAAGFEGAAEIMATYDELYEKWKGLTADINGDRDKFTALLAEHVYKR